MVNILTRAIMMSTPLLLGALAEVYAERTGMMICAIEGIFLIGAWGGFVGTYLSGSLLVGLLLAIALGGLMALLYAFVTVTLGQQQVVTGTAMNILAVGFCSYFMAREYQPASIVSLVYFFKPALSPVLAWALHGEEIPLNMLLGIILIVAGSFCASVPGVIETKRGIVFSRF